jgi:cobalt transporter subunit CbtB
MAGSGAEVKEGRLTGDIARRAEAIRQAIGAALLGALIIFFVGFAQPQALHDAAHDTRHAYAFPCH